MSRTHRATNDMIGLHPLWAVAAGLAPAACPAALEAARSEFEVPCGSDGGPAFRGTSTDATAASFLTAIRPPSFGLGDALGIRHDSTRMAIDALNVVSPSGLRLSTSGCVAPGAGNRLARAKRKQGDCAVAHADRTGGLALPPPVGGLSGRESGGGGSSGGTDGGVPDGSERALLGNTARLVDLVGASSLDAHALGF